jgi:ATP-binding cassette subfamily B protein
MIAFGWVTNLLQRGLASWIRILQVLDSAPAISDTETTSEIPGISSVRGDVEFRNLTFAYDEQAVLHNISAIFPAGQTTAIVGATGSGKSTLLSLIARLYDPPPGTVFVDDIDVHRIPLAILRGAVGFVPQEPFLFSDTLAENITFGVKESQLSNVSLKKAAQVSRLDKDLQEFPEGYQTLVGERGITLSGGQKQRTAIARALVIDPKILVLDDALSAVDTHTEEEILIQLRAVMKQRTSIIVSHRISTVRQADQILVLDQGRIVERGCHDELVASQGIYAALHRRQLLEEELAAS